MAGSYKHVMGDDGHWSHIENMGDAYECVEELLWLVLYFSRAAAKVEDPRPTISAVLDTIYYPMVRGEVSRDGFYELVQERMDK